MGRVSVAASHPSRKNKNAARVGHPVLCRCTWLKGRVEIETKRAVVLLSGGLDSATVLAIARSQGYELYALSFRYGQRHVWELEAAARVAASIGVVKHRTANIDLRIFGGS